MNESEKSFGKIFIEKLGNEKKTKKIIKALQHTDQILKQRIGDVADTNIVINFFFSMHKSGKLEANLQYYELMSFWDKFAPYEEKTRKERWSYFLGEPFIIQTIYQMFAVKQWNQIEHHYILCNTIQQKRFHVLLKEIFERNDTRILCMIDLCNGKIILKGQYYLKRDYIYKNLEDLLLEKDLEILTAIEMILHSFLTMGVIFLTVKNATGIVNEGIWLYQKQYHKIPMDIMDKILQNIMIEDLA